MSDANPAQAALLKQLEKILTPEFLDSVGAKEDDFYPALISWADRYGSERAIEALEKHKATLYFQPIPETDWDDGFKFATTEAIEGIDKQIAVLKKAKKEQK